MRLASSLRSKKKSLDPLNSDLLQAKEVVLRAKEFVLQTKEALIRLNKVLRKEFERR